MLFKLDPNRGVSGALPLGCAERLRLSGPMYFFFFSFAPPEGYTFRRRECGRYLAPITERRSLSAQRAAKPLVIIQSLDPIWTGLGKMNCICLSVSAQLQSLFPVHP